MDVNDLLNAHSFERVKGSPPLTASEIEERLALVPGWEVQDDGKTIRLSLRMEGFRAAIDLVNQVAELAEDEDHHPDIRVFGYRNVEIDYSTHSIDALSDNDFICAAKVNRLRGQA